MTETKPQLRWFRFSLRTLFVLVAVISVPLGWFAYQLNWVRERNEFINGLQAASREKACWTLAEVGGHLDDKRQVSFIRELLGDQAYSRLLLPANFDTFLVSKANNLFPESQIWHVKATPLTGIFVEDVSARRVD